MKKELTIKELINKYPAEVEKLLEDYSKWLEKGSYMDSDWWAEEPKAVITYLEPRQ